MVTGRSKIGFSLNADGLDVFREITRQQSFLFGHGFHDIGEWLIENEYRLYLLYREIIVKHGHTYDSDSVGGFFMESEEHHVAFRMRWF